MKKIWWPPWIFIPAAVQQDPHFSCLYSGMYGTGGQLKHQEETEWCTGWKIDAEGHEAFHGKPCWGRNRLGGAGEQGKGTGKAFLTLLQTVWHHRTRI